jgi:hypothetical protein
LSHVTDGEASKGSVLREGLDTHWACWLELDDGGIAGLDESWGFLKNLAATLIDLLLDLVEFAGDVSGMAIKNWGVLVADLTWVVEDNNLG